MRYIPLITLINNVTIYQDVLSSSYLYEDNELDRVRDRYKLFLALELDRIDGLRLLA